MRIAFPLMMWLPLTRLALALMTLQGVAPSSTHTWIADLKAKRASLGTHDLYVEGLVVDIRSTSSEAKRGLYRLIDESDREGVLVRTTRLPAEGGSYRVRTLVAASQPLDGSLLLEEVSRDRTDSPSPIPLILGALSLVLLIVLGVLLIRAARAERKYLVSPPLWLLPEAGPYGKAASPGEAPAASINLDPDLEEVDLKQRNRLRHKRRRLVRALGIAGLSLAGSAAWLAASRTGRAPVPAFILIDANDAVAVPAPPPPPPDTVFADRPLEPSIDSLPAARAPRRDSVPRRPGPTLAGPLPVRKGDSVASGPGPGGTSQPQVSPLPVTPAPAPAPAPAPPPPPPPETAPADTRPTRPDPEVERSRATATEADGIGRIVAAINGKRLTELLILLPESMAGSSGRLERFLNLVKDFTPRATLGTVEPVALADDAGEARFTVSFTWRGDFGVERRKTARFTGVVRRQDGGWRFEGARLLDPVP